jgi:hypothetical protein
MKDKDFERLENKIEIERSLSEGLKAILKRDSEFMRENGLIDYSLIVIKINYNAYREDAEREGREVAYNSRTMHKSVKQGEENIMYVLGIIDYLETWNVRKRG